MTLPGGTSVDTAALAAPPDGREPVYASWSRRVVASLLDAALASGLTFLVLPELGGNIPFLGPQLIGLGNAPSGTPWIHNPWIIAMLVVAVALQAYGGGTPGKLVVGIAVVGESDARPLGLVRTLLRWLAHLLDAILLIGYLRPLWHPKRKTFADSIVGSIVLVTRQPLPHRWFTSRALSGTELGPPVVWEAAAVPPWREWATRAAAIACGLGLLFSVGPSAASTRTSADLRCAMTAPGTAPAELIGVTLHQTITTSTSTRWGVTRQTARPSQDVSVSVVRHGSPSLNEAATLRLTLTGADGELVSQDFPLDDAGGTDPTMTLPPHALDQLGDSWTWAASVVVNGVESPACTGTGPAA